MNVTVYTRHSSDCSKRTGSAANARNGCPSPTIAASRAKVRRLGLGRKPKRKRKPWNGSPREGHARSTERKTIHSAVELFLKNKKGDGIEDGSYYNQDLTIRKQFLGWTKSRCPALSHTQLTVPVIQSQMPEGLRMMKRLDGCSALSRVFSRRHSKRAHSDYS
jgi:hypothetical protein